MGPGRARVAGAVPVPGDFDVQEQELTDGVRLLPAAATEPTRLPALGGSELDHLVGRLREARLPVLIVDFSGRGPETVAPLVALADALGLAVVDRGNRMNFPSTHQLNVSGTGLLDAADLVIALEVQDLVGALGSFLPLTDEGLPANGAEVVTLGFNELLTIKWAADYQQFVPVSLAVAADTGQSVSALREVAEDPQGPFAAAEFTERREERVKTLCALHTEARAEWARQADEARDREHIQVSTAVQEIHRAVVRAHPAGEPRSPHRRQLRPGPPSGHGGRHVRPGARLRHPRRGPFPGAGLGEVAARPGRAPSGGGVTENQVQQTGEPGVELRLAQPVEPLRPGVPLLQQPGLAQDREVAAQGGLGDGYVEAAAGPLPVPGSGQLPHQRLPYGVGEGEQGRLQRDLVRGRVDRWGAVARVLPPRGLCRHG